MVSESAINNSAICSRGTWLAIWRNIHFQNMPFWDDQCQLVYDLIVGILPANIQNKLILESGSGTGRVSLRLAREGARVVLLDISRDAISFNKNLFRTCHASGDFIMADISHLPFKNDTFDSLWSSGVLEHFTCKQLDEIFYEQRIALKSNGLLIAIVPNRRAHFYNFSRILDMKLGKWQWGYEEPLSSRDLSRLRWKPFIIRSTGFIYQLKFFSFPRLGYFYYKLFDYFYPRLNHWDKNLPGYLIAGVWKKDANI